MSESEGPRTATEDDGKPSESDTIQKNSNLSLKRYHKVKAEIQTYEGQLRMERETYNATWNAINSKEKSIKGLQEKIKTLQQEIDALVIEESSINQSMKIIQEKKEALEQELFPFLKERVIAT
ncbi:unnamed protein product [Adineta ricciae]|uniref:Uncharacterized protein n=1 Tax=Adineta ricciae TaxID=249248 RepID=A0A816BQW8_ADIRI|nr:unnamed protein product [Adineta ricciae]CAF1611518.1 unnamed protein product [Adineta ricciae]